MQTLSNGSVHALNEKKKLTTSAEKIEEESSDQAIPPSEFASASANVCCSLPLISQLYQELSDFNVLVVLGRGNYGKVGKDEEKVRKGNRRSLRGY